MITLNPKCFDDWYQERFAPSDNMSSCYGQMPELANFLLEEYCEKCQNRKLLGIEFGCGDGRFACEFLSSRRFSHFTVTDKYDFALERTRERAGEFAENLSTIKHIHGEKNDNEKVWLAFFDNNKEKFDLVVTANMFHYLTDEKISVVLNEANSLLKKGGILYVCFESDIRLSADGVEFRMPGQTDCNDARIVEIAENSGFECARRQISLLGEKIFSLPKSAQTFLGVEATHYTRNICLHEYIFIKNTTEGYRSESIFPYDDYGYALHASDSSRKMKDVQEQILNLARNTVSNVKGKTPFEICNSLRDGWNDILRLYSKDELPFRAVHLKYHNLDIDETTMAESKWEKNRSGAREYIFPAINWSSLLFKENARYSSASFCVIEDANNEDDAGKDSFFIGNHMSLSIKYNCPKCFKSVIDMCKSIGLSSGEEDGSRDETCEQIVITFYEVLSSSENCDEIKKCIDQWRKIAEKSMCYNLESAILEIINKNADFWGYKNIHGEFVSMTKPAGFTDAELWMIVFFFKMFLSEENQFIAMAVDGLGSGRGVAQTGAFLTGMMPSKFRDKRDELIYKGLFIKSCDYALAVIRRYQLELVNGKKLTYALHSAVSSIMSRNGSHNIGSHVLAALSHNVGTMPDDRVLYQYIQHRMDYIATVTTDFPTWTQPTMLLGSLMKGFLSQRHLLDHIAESEGLSAWQFQGCKLSDEERKKQHWIEFHVRRKTNDGSYEELIEYPNGAVHLDKDVSLAMPGGVVGHHAFYTILENILRNAAKHDWSVSENGKARKEREGDLPIYIDFDDDPEKDNVEIEIWARLREEEKATTSLTNVDDWHKKLEAGVKKNLEDFSQLPLPHRLQVLIERPFINDNGQLRRENWGLAEMKISAGYLRRSSIDVIGGLKRDEYKPENALILPMALKKTVKVDDKDVSGTYLAYRFSIPKPRELLIIVENIDDNDNVKTRIADAKKHGVYVRTWKEIKAKGETDVRALELNYRFVVHYAVTKKVLTSENVKFPNENVKFPFRVLSGQAVDVNDMVPLFEEYSEVVKELLAGKTDKGKDVDAKTAAENALKAVYACWCKHIVTKYRKDIGLGKDGKIGLLIAPSEASHTGGHSLISDADILKYVMRESFEKCVEQYKVICGDLPVKERAMLDEFANLCQGAREIDGVALDKNNSNPHDNIARFLYKWVSDAIIDPKLNGDKKRALQNIKEEIEKSYHVEEERADDEDEETPPDNLEDKRESENTKVEGDRNSAAREVMKILNKGSIDGFIEYIESVHEQVKSLFKQYEENIVSLPDGYRPKKDDGVDNSGGASKIKDFGGIAKVAFNAKVATSLAGVKWIAYRRHDNSLTENIKFAEPLSGTQSYLTQIARLADGLRTSSETTIANAEDFGLCVRLLENGLMRMLVIDERVAKFVREHKSEVESTYKSMWISVLDDELKSDTGTDSTDIDIIRRFRENPRNENPMSLLGKFEILIIHQGVLDKWFPNEKNDKMKMAKILDGFKKMVKYVVITTGRGTPSNIPEDAHLIPFAVVEAALFRKYPEKLILVDAVMNVLAIGKHENAGG